MSRIRSSAVAAFVALGAASCTVSPYSGQVMSTNTVPFEGLTDTPGAPVGLDGYVWSSAHFVTLGSATTGTTPYFVAGAICPNSPALYRFQGSIKLNWPIYWRFVNSTTYEAKVRATQYANGGQLTLMFTDNPSAGPCMAEHAFNSTCDFYQVAYDTCGYKLPQATVISHQLAPWEPAGS